MSHLYPFTDHQLSMLIIGSGKAHSDLAADIQYIGAQLSADEKPDKVKVVAVYNVHSAPQVVIFFPEHLAERWDDDLLMRRSTENLTGHYRSFRFYERDAGHNGTIYPRPRLSWYVNYNNIEYESPEWVIEVVERVKASGENHWVDETFEKEKKEYYRQRAADAYGMVASGRAEHIDEVL